jgi:uncharacterized protein
MAKVPAVSCPRCGVQVKWSAENRFRPFCSERCKLTDLGHWAMERYRVSIVEDKDGPDDQERE